MAMLSQDQLQQSVAQSMHRDFSRLRVELTVGEALAEIRRNPPPNRIIYFYVVNEHNQLQGVIPTRRLLLSELDRPLAEIMIREVITIPEQASVLDACEFFVMHRLLAFPVVDSQRRIVGVVDVELYTEELSELDRSERNDDLFQLIGVHLAASQQASSLSAFRARFPWLLTNIAGGILAAFLSGIFEAELQKAVALALFIPVVLALAESVSIQSVSLALQFMHGQPPSMRALVAKLRQELVTGSLLGLACAACVVSVALIWLGDVKVAICLAAGIFGGVSAAAVVGVALPNLLRLAQRDPRVAAGPIALASSDMMTLLIYFNVARWLMQGGG